MDHGGSFELDTITHNWDQYQHSRMFYSCYVAFVMSKRMRQMRQNSIKILVVDGTFTTSCVFKRTILLAATKDGNNQLCLLAYALVDTENWKNWLWFLETLVTDFPGVCFIEGIH